MSAAEVDVDEPGPEPCYGCACCELWQGALQLLRDHTARHVAGELRLAPCDPECLLCAEIDWQGPPKPDDAARAELRAELAAGIDPDWEPVLGVQITPPKRRWWQRRG